MEEGFVRERMTAEEINELPLIHYEGPVTLVRDDRTYDRALEALWAEPVIGFDTETRPCFKKGVVHNPSLIQLATESEVFLIQLHFVPLRRDLLRLLSSPKHLKVGVAINDDMKALARMREFTPNGMMDLSTIADKHKIYAHGLRSLVASFFGRRLSKGPQCSDWSLPDLSPKQIVYAATDAWVGRMLYLRMRELGLLERQ